jgi:hypothetical protein
MRSTQPESAPRLSGRVGPEFESPVDRALLVQLADRLIAGDYRSEAELDRDASEFKAAVPHPSPLDLIFHWQTEFDHAPSADEVVDRALAYRPIEL